MFVPQVSMLALLVSPFVAFIGGFFFPNHLPIVPSRAAADHQVHDWLALIEREVRYIWQSDSSIIKVLFIITRYGPFFDMPITITSESDSSVGYCWYRGNADLSLYSSVVHTAPYGAIAYDVGADVLDDRRWLRNRNITDMQYPL